MKYQLWAVITETGDHKLLKNDPGDRWGSVVIPIIFDIPDSAFRPIRLPLVKIVLTEEAMPNLVAIEKEINSLTGQGVKIQIVDGSEVKK